MDELDQKLGQILGNPQLMGTIMELASSLGAGSTPGPSADAPAPGMIPEPAGIDDNQQALLRALTPYVSPGRVSRLEKAMRAAKMARLASAFLGSGGWGLLTGGTQNV